MLTIVTHLPKQSPGWCLPRDLLPSPSSLASGSLLIILTRNQRLGLQLLPPFSSNLAAGPTISSHFHDLTSSILLPAPGLCLFPATLPSFEHARLILS